MNKTNQQSFLRKFQRIAAFAAVFLPHIALAQDSRTFSSLIRSFIELLGRIVPLIGALFALMLFWGLFKFIARGATSEKGREEGRFLMMWGVIGLFIMTTIWGILAFMLDQFGFGGLGIPSLPTG